MSDAEPVQDDPGVLLSDLPQPEFEGAVDPATLSVDGDNPNEMREETMNLLTRRIRDRGWLGGPIITDTSGTIADGEHRWRAARDAGLSEVPVKQFDFSDAERRIVRQELNRIRGDHDPASDASEIESIIEQGRAADIEEVLAFTAHPAELDGILDQSDSDEVDAFLDSLGDHPAQQPFGEDNSGDDDDGRVDADGELYPDGEEGSLARDFIAPPLTTLDARQGYWRRRKDVWHSTGMDSGAGRDAEAFDNIGAANRSGQDTDTSIFDPVLAEVLLEWFAPDAGTVLDPFAGGVVRGALSGWLGYEYTGVDISPEQVDANEVQWATLRDAVSPANHIIPEDNTPETTPVQSVAFEGDGAYVKRDDLYCWSGVSGGKGRALRRLFTEVDTPPAGLTIACARESPNVTRLASMAAVLGVPARIHLPKGPDTEPMKRARAIAADHGADVEFVRGEAGYNNVLESNAAEDAEERGWMHVPFGVSCEAAVETTAAEFERTELPPGVTRLVVPVGSGTTLAGILTGMDRADVSVPVRGVRLGMDPEDTLDSLAPPDWRERVEFVDSELEYHDFAPDSDCTLDGVPLDPGYEAKCLPFMEPGDLLWSVAIRQTENPEAYRNVEPVDPVWVEGDAADLDAALDADTAQFDFAFTCPPYHDLEQYTDREADMSNMDYDDFLAAYRSSIEGVARHLKDGHFFAIVVGDVRDSDGAYRGLVNETVQAAQDAGMSLYNDAVFITPLGSLPIRARNTFNPGRKLGKAHQNVLVFVNGTPDMELIAETLGDATVNTRKTVAQEVDND